MMHVVVLSLSLSLLLYYCAIGGTRDCQSRGSGQGESALFRLGAGRVLCAAAAGWVGRRVCECYCCDVMWCDGFGVKYGYSLLVCGVM